MVIIRNIGDAEHPHLISEGTAGLEEPPIYRKGDHGTVPADFPAPDMILWPG